VAGHIVWDWNGTLLDDNDAVVAAVNAVCARYGREPISLEEWRAVFRRPISQTYEELLGRALTAADWATIDGAYHREYERLVPGLDLAVDARAALKDWRDGGGTQSLLSMWFHEDLVTLAGRLGVAGEFVRIDGLRSGIGGESKAAYLLAHLRELGLDPADVVLIGDVVDDAAAAAGAGTRCVLLTTGISTPQQLARAGVPVVDSLTAAVDVVRANRAGRPGRPA
jgi:phosphoglycolate phosphatase-like HAD superfamily hydrolase